MSNQTSETKRCKGIKPDGKRCKIQVHEGHDLCEHHDTDLEAFVRNPEKCIEIMSGRYPKIHHPACDRKGVNDCECPSYTGGAQVMRTMQKAFKDSASYHPLYRKLNKMRMRVKVKKIRNYYNSISEKDLWLPTKPAWRQYRFFVWDDKQERVVVRIIKDNIRDKATLLRWLKRLAPLHVYYTTAAWMNPQGIGPDPFGKKGRNKFRKKGWSYKTKTYHNNFLWQELYFDVDYCNADYNEGAKTLGSLINELDKEPNLFSPREELTIVFSGGKGFHLVDTNWRTMDLFCGNDKEINRIKDRYGYDIAKPEDRQKFSRFIKQQIINDLKEGGILIDYDVTPDPRRIIRLPGTVHGKTLRVCKIITENDLLRNEAGEIVGYEPDEPIG
tara:strand:+ start:13471 stop:14628 length:1158 start_codon:yes stop_codon:yes gene_type:complete